MPLVPLRVQRTALSRCRGRPLEFRCRSCPAAASAAGRGSSLRRRRGRPVESRTRESLQQRRRQRQWRQSLGQASVLRGPLRPPFRDTGTDAALASAVGPDGGGVCLPQPGWQHRRQARGTSRLPGPPCLLRASHPPGPEAPPGRACVAPSAAFAAAFLAARSAVAACGPGERGGVGGASLLLTRTQCRPPASAHLRCHDLGESIS